MSDDGEQLYRCYSSDPQKALQLLSSWDQQRIRDAAQYKDKAGHTPLHWACHYGHGHDKVVEMLLKHGADAKAKNNVSPVPPSSPPLPPYDGAPVPHDDDDAVPGGNTPLHMACRYGHDKVVEMLLKHGADAEVKNNSGQTPLDFGCQRGHGDKLEPVFAAHVASPSAWLPPLPSPAPTLETTASVVVAVDKWLKPLLPERTTTHLLPYLDAFITGAVSHLPNRGALANMKKTIDGAPLFFSSMDWAAFKVTTTQALVALDQALQAPEALNSRLSQLDPNSDNLESVLQELHQLTKQFDLQPVLRELQAALAAYPAPSTTPASTPETPPTDLAAALDKVIALSGVGPELQELLSSSNYNLKALILTFIDALVAVARAGTTDTIHRVDTLRKIAHCQEVDAAPPAEALPEAWEQLCQAHEKLSLSEQNGLEQIALWQAPPEYEHQGWYLTFVLHESQALAQQLQDMIGWQTTTLSALTSCIEYAHEIMQSNADQVVSAHEEMAKLQEQIQATTAFLSFAPDKLRPALEDDLQEKRKHLVALQQKLSAEPHVDHVAALAQLLHQHFPALLVFLHPEQSVLGKQLRTVFGADLPTSLILEAMTEVDRGLTLSSLGQLSLQYNQNHKVYKARAALPNLPEQDLAVKEYALAEQHKQDQCRTFLRELRAMRQLEHPHIIPVLGALMDMRDGHPSAYLVQPWCTQGDLQQWLGKARHLATSTVIAGLMNQLRTALAFMHSKGLVHRDVKLSNVMLDGSEDQPVVRLGDFDIAKAAAAATMLPYTVTAASGTAGYVAPELLFGLGRVGARPAQDAFSFGCVLYNTYMFPQTVPPARLPTDQLADKCKWDAGAGDADCCFSHLAAEMCDSTSDLYKETRAFLATDPKQRPSLFSAAQSAQQPALAQVGPAIDVLRDAPDLTAEVTDLLKQLSSDGRGPANVAVLRVERVQNPVLWERYSAKRREMLHRIKRQEHNDQLQTATLDALPGFPALLRDTACQERLLLHGIGPDRSVRDKIVRLGFDYRFAGSSAGHRFGLGVYMADHPGKSHQYAGAGPNGERMLIITRALLGHAYAHPKPPSGALAPPLLPDAPNNERYDSVVATPPREFHEVILFDNTQIYPELVVYYTAD